jgi:hypothetical protein
MGGVSYACLVKWLRNRGGFPGNFSTLLICQLFSRRGISIQSLPLIEVRTGLIVKFPFVSDCDQNSNVSTNFSKTPQYKISLKSVQPFLCCYVQADRMTDTLNITGAFFNWVSNTHTYTGTTLIRCQLICLGVDCSHIFLAEEHSWVQALENKVLRKTLGPARNEMRREFKMFAFRSSSILRILKCRSSRWSVHIAQTAKQNTLPEIWWTQLLESSHLEDREGDGRMRVSCKRGRSVVRMRCVQWPAVSHSRQ